MNDDAIIFVVVGSIGLVWAAFFPDWFRRQADKAKPRLTKKHGSFISGLRAEQHDSQPLTDEESWNLIREAATLQSRVVTALFCIFTMSVPVVYPLYAGAVSGPNIPYWQEPLLGVSLGLMFAIIFRVCGNIAFRVHARRLVS